MKSSNFALKAVWLLTLLPLLGSAQLQFTNGTLTLTENYNGLANSGTSSVLPSGWFFSESGTNANTTYAADNGATSTGNTYSYGTTAASERALGEVASGSLVSTFGTAFTNNTDSAIVKIRMSFYAELWRKGVTSVKDSAIFEYSTDATSLTTGTWTTYNKLSLVTANLAASVGAVDGNLAANRLLINDSITGISVGIGSTIWVRWRAVNISGNDDGLSIDDFSATGVKGAAVLIPATINVSGFEKSVLESSGTASFYLKISGSNTSASTINVNTSSWSTATAAADYTLSSSTVTFPANSATNDSLPVTITINDDVLAENAEYIIFTISSGTNANPGANAQYILYITDNDMVTPAGSNELGLTLLTSFSNGVSGTNSAEIVAFDSLSKRLFIANSVGAKMDIVNFANPSAPVLITSISVTPYGNINSLATYNGIVAAAIENSTNPQDSGRVVFFNSSGVFLNSVKVGMMPDMITFNHAGTKVYTANEGEPNAAYTNDPDGSISVINISGGIAGLTQANVSHITFTAYNGSEASLRAQGIRIFGPGATTSKDFEPEYITISDDDSKAWVTLQENNALVEINLTTNAITKLIPLGYKDLSASGNAIDASDVTSGVNIANWPVKGMFMPDAIGHFSKNNTIYLVTANEGDSRAYSGFNEESRVSALSLDPAKFPNASHIKSTYALGRLNATNKLGDTDNDGDIDTIFVYGSRSFSIWNPANGARVYDSGSELERITNADATYGSIFNASNGTVAVKKNRSDDKGPEPEGVATATIDGREYAFIALERIGGVMVYNVTNPAAPYFVKYANNRLPDLGAEGVIYISATASPNGKSLVILANEISSTLSVYQIDSYQGISSTQTPYLQPTVANASFRSVMTVADSALNGYKMCGIPDGVGAFDNNDGTFTLLMNHEMSNSVGVTRAHGSAGAFVSKWKINKSTLSVVNGSDLMQNVNIWNGSGYTTYNASNPNAAATFNRFCSADLAPVSAFYNQMSGLGTKERIYLNGEEAGNEGRIVGHIVTGTNSGTSYELPYLGKYSVENVLASPFPSDKTIVIGMDDQTPGQVYVYIGNKSNTGTEIDKAGLTGGTLYGVAVSGLTAEVSAGIPAANTAFSLLSLGQVQGLTGATINTNSNSAGITNFLRPEDGAWDPANPNDFYFATTNSFTNPSRLWKLHFNDIANPQNGGTITAVLDGTEGQKMFDNLTIDNSGHIYIQEDPGNQAHNAKVWMYTIATDVLTQVGQHDPARFILGGSLYLTQDEESSGIIDVQSILGSGMFLVADQAHYSLPGQLVEGGQFLTFYNSTTAVSNPEIAVKGNNTVITNEDLTASLADSTDFGSITVNTSRIRTFKIENNGTGALTVNALSISGVNASSFSILSAPTLPFNIPASGSVTLSVNFAPTSVGTKDAVINLYNSDADEMNFYYAIKGNAICTVPTATVAAGGPTTFCQGGSVSLTAASASSYVWSTGATTQQITVNAGGTYSVTVTDANGCTNTSSAQSVTVNALPNVAVATPTVCAGNSAVLTATGASTYVWSTGATTASITIISPSGATVYTVTGTASNGCTKSTTASVQVNALPTVSISAGGPLSFCQGGSVTLTASSASSYLWTGNISTQQITVSTTGNYVVTVTNANGCSNAASQFVNVYSLPTVSASSNVSGNAVCAGNQITLNGAGAPNYNWSNGVNNGVSFVPSSSQTYTVTGTDANGCSNTATIAVQVNALPVPGIFAGGPLSFCQGGSVTLTASAAASYLWTGNFTTQQITVNNAGTYSVTVTDANGCSGTASQSVSVYSLPPVSASSNASGNAVCAGNQITLNGAGASNYSWSNGINDGVSFAPSSSQTYTVTGTDANGCSNTATLAVQVNALPPATISASGPLSFCQGGSVVLSAPSAASYMWTGNLSTQQITVNSTGTYSVAVTDANGCSNSSSQSVNVYSLPVVLASSDAAGDSLCSGNQLTLNGSGALNYSWSSGITNGVSFVPSSSQTYTVTGTDANGCSSSDVIAITVNTCLGLNTSGSINSVEIYPNPASAYFVINITNANNEKVNYSIFDGEGKQVVQGIAEYTNETIRINTSEFSNGIYFVRIQSASVNEIQKVVINR